jgi:hypothetical protein
VVGISCFHDTNSVLILTFGFYRLNTCPFQGSRTIRTEEAVLITLATLSPLVARVSHTKEELKPEDMKIDFSDDEPSDESSSNSEESGSDSGSESSGDDDNKSKDSEDDDDEEEEEG